MRVLKKCTKKTSGKCFECKFAKILDNVYVECQAENRPTFLKINAYDYCCIEQPNLNELSHFEIEKIKDKSTRAKDKREYIKWVRNYAPTPEQAERRLREEGLIK